MTEQRTVVIQQPNYFPWLGYLDRIRTCDVFVFLDTVQYIRRNYTNRTRLRIGADARWITVPVSGEFHDPISVIRIDNASAWQRKHLLTIERNYAKSEFFAEYWPRVNEILTREWELLSEMNMEICRWYGELLGNDTEFIAASELDLNPDLSSSALLAGIAHSVSATTYVAGEGGRKYMDYAPFEEVGIPVHWQDYQHPEYPQLGPSMVTGLSALDGLFNCGIDGLVSLISELSHRA